MQTKKQIFKNYMMNLNHTKHWDTSIAQSTDTKDSGIIKGD